MSVGILMQPVVVGYPTTRGCKFWFLFVNYTNNIILKDKRSKFNFSPSGRYNSPVSYLVPQSLCFELPGCKTSFACV